MPPRPRRTFPARRTGTRRRYAWAETSATYGPTAIGNFSVSDLLAGYRGAGGNTNETSIMRVHLKIQIASAVAAGDGFKIGLLTGQINTVGAYAGGVPSTPDPLALPYLDWMWLEQFGAHPGYSNTGPNNQVIRDIKSRRRIRELNDTLLISIYNTGAVANLSAVVYCRVLLGLP
jgi:hypothetical protein